MARKLIIHLTPRRWDFVDDPALREIVSRDYEELRRLIRRGADKSVVVLSGTIVEALLAGILSKDKEAAIQAWKDKNPGKEPKPFNEWTIYQLIQASVRLGILDGSTEILASALQNFRNLIHPLVMERKSITLNSGTVSTAVSLLVSVLDFVETGRTQEVVDRLKGWVALRGLVPTLTSTGAYLPKLYVDGEPFTLFSQRKNKIQIRFGRLKRSNSPFKIRARREELRQRLNGIGLNLPSRVIDALPSIPLEYLAAPGRCEAFIKVLDWMVAIIKNTQPETEPGSSWTEERFFATLRKQRPGQEVEPIAQSLWAWCNLQADAVNWGTGKQIGSFNGLIRWSNDRAANVFNVWTDGKIVIGFGSLSSYPPFDEEAKRRELLERLNAIPGLRLPNDSFGRFPSFPLLTLKDESSFQQFVAAIQWTFDELRTGRDKK